jgi:hypothetical protein
MYIPNLCIRNEIYVSNMYCTLPDDIKLAEKVGVLKQKIPYMF